MMMGGLWTASVELVPTFENCSVYVAGPDAAQAKQLRYRERGGKDWLPGHPLSVSASDPQPRGSLFGLRPGTVYEVQCLDAGGAVLAGGETATWREEVPIARTIDLGERWVAGKGVVIDQGGSENGWVRYVAAPGRVLDGGDADEDAILVRAAYVILDGLTVRGGQRNAIRIAGTNHVRVRGCDVAGYGRIGKLNAGGRAVDANGSLINYDSGVNLDKARQTVVESCWIHDPRGTANSWEFSHPMGPNAMAIRAHGGTVLRWNDCIGSDTHRWNDVIEGKDNGDPDGGFDRDADIYGNYLAFGNDDGIELDGGQCNVRFYGNLVQGTYCGISTAPNVRGPSYIYGNVIANLADERGKNGAVVKNGGSSRSTGISFFYHNSCWTDGAGMAGVGFGSDPDRERFIGVTRNNIFAVTRAGIRDAIMPAGCDYDYDLFAKPDGGGGRHSDGKAIGTHMITAEAGYVDATAGDFRLTDASKARGSAERIPGFASIWPGVQPDRGALGGPGAPQAVPWRPIAVRAAPAVLRFSAAAVQPLSVQVESSASQPMTFTIRRNDAADWFTVLPARGVLAKGRRVELQVVLNDRVRRDRLAPGAFTIACGGSSIPVTVLADLAGSAVHLPAAADLEAKAAASLAAPLPAEERAPAAAARAQPATTPSDEARARWNAVLQERSLAEARLGHGPMFRCTAMGGVQATITGGDEREVVVSMMGSGMTIPWKAVGDADRCAIALDLARSNQAGDAVLAAFWLRCLGRLDEVDPLLLRAGKGLAVLDGDFPASN